MSLSAITRVIGDREHRRQLGIFWRIELISWRNFFGEVLRDRLFAIILLFLGALAFLLIWHGARVVSAHDWLAVVAPLGVGYGLFAAMWRSPHRVARDGLHVGMFHAFLSHGRYGPLWESLRAALLSLCAMVLISVPVALSVPSYAPVFMAMMIAGGLVGRITSGVLKVEAFRWGAGGKRTLEHSPVQLTRHMALSFCLAAQFFRKRGRPTGGATLSDCALGRPSFIAPAMWAGLCGRWWQGRAGRLPEPVIILVLWGLGLAAGAAASRSPSVGHLGQLIVLGCNLLFGGLLVVPDLSALHFFARRDTPLVRVVQVVSLPATVMVLFMILISLIAADSLGSALRIAGVSAVGIVLWQVVLGLHGVRRRSGAALRMAGLDLALALLLSAVLMTPIAGLLWGVARGLWLMRNLPVARWRDSE